LDSNFENGEYFKYLKLNDVKSRLKRSESNQDKINGKFSVLRAPQLSKVDRINAISNDDMVYYIHQRNRLFKQIDNMGLRIGDDEMDEESKII